ncbi:MAG: YcaO-like family protein [Alphaproteobacteria bacterium]|nr:YcaO-like family protein [Alphaproteobacteria bacterium]
MTSAGLPIACAAAETALPKAFRQGTHRIVAPSETFARFRPLALQMGITRLGNITGLDRIGIPVVAAVRPNSRSVSVSQGKGLDLSQAMTSALMEAIEGFHAEEVGKGRRAAYREFAPDRVVDPLTLCTTGRPFDVDASISWLEGFDLLRQEPCWVPAEIVHTDYTQPLDGYFLSGSNGLASGNHLVEALSAAICELIERDAVAIWSASGIRARAQRSLEVASVDDPDCLALLAKYDDAGIAVRLWDVTTDIGIAAFVCDIRDLSVREPRRLRYFHGAGCHPDRVIALVRALTEAAQTRLTYIAGIRDDLLPVEYEEPAAADIVDALLDALRQESLLNLLHDAPTFAADDLGEDLRHELACLQSAGITRAVAVDLTRPDFAIPVVRVVIPGLDGDIKHPHYHPGMRARRAAVQA